MNGLARRQIRAAATETLRRAGVYGVVPTPLEAVTRSAGIVEILDVADLPPDLEAKKPNILQRVLGGLVYRERIVFLDGTQPEPRGRFTNGHEVIHKVLPWHEAAFRLDDERTLFRDTRELLEMEANFGAAELLFQGAVFMKRALDFRLTMDAPLALSGDFRASREATVRYYVENHPDRVALLVAGRYLNAAGQVPVFVSAQSVSFHARYGSAANALGHRLSARAGSEIGDIVAEAMRSMDVVRGKVVIEDLHGQRRGLMAEAFFNQYKVFFLIAEAGIISIGKKVVVATVMPAQAATTR